MTTDVSSRQVQLSDVTVDQVNAALLLLCQWINELSGIGNTLPPGLNASAWVLGTNNRVTVSDNGDGTVTLSTPQEIATTSSPTFLSTVLTGLTASRLLAASASKSPASVTDLTDWIGGTANQVTVADDGDGTVTLSTPQDLGEASSPSFQTIKVYGADGYLLHGFGDVGA